MPVFLPYNCVKDFIETHPVVTMSMVSPSKVHAAMVRVLEVEAAKQAQQQRSCRRQGGIAKEDYCCKICNNRDHEINAREADIVCRSCGATSKYIGADAETCMYYTERVTQTFDECLGGDTLLERTVRDEILHWSHMPGSLLKTSSDQINRTVEHALRINRGSATERAVCALLLPTIRDTLDIASIETKIRQREELPTMPAVKTCAALHACATCGESFSEKWCLRRHKCNQSYSKKRQRHW